MKKPFYRRVKPVGITNPLTMFQKAALIHGLHEKKFSGIQGNLIYKSLTPRPESISNAAEEQNALQLGQGSKEAKALGKSFVIKTAIFDPFAVEEEVLKEDKQCCEGSTNLAKCSQCLTKIVQEDVGTQEVVDKNPESSQEQEKEAEEEMEMPATQPLEWDFEEENEGDEQEGKGADAAGAESQVLPSQEDNSEMAEKRLKLAPHWVKPWQ